LCDWDDVSISAGVVLIAVAALVAAAAAAIALILALAPSVEDEARDYCKMHAPIALQDSCVADRLSGSR
jgi:hypothetical protein